MATLSFRIDDALKDRIDRLSDQQALNVSEICRQALAEKIDELQHGPNRSTGFPLSLKERLILSNQYRMLAALCPNEADYYRQQVDVLVSGYELHYPWMVQGFAEGMNRDECKEVLDILDMYSDLNQFGAVQFKKLNIERNELDFLGFDGNHETQQLAYARYFLFDLDRFSSLHASIKKRGLDSHMPMLNVYRQMLPVWRERRHPPDPLSAQEIKDILAAQPWRKSA